MRVALIGATGLVGSHLVPRLLDHDLLILTRRAGGWSQPNLREIVAPADEWPSQLAGEQIDAAISTLGTTWRKARSWAAFEAVDRTAVVEFARAAQRAGAGQMISVSSVGADAGSANGYLALKGRAEEDLRRIGFDRLDLFRPGLLRGVRGNDRRLKERLGIAISPLANLFLRGPFDRFAAIDVDRVAAAIAGALGLAGKGVFVHYNREIRELAARRSGLARSATSSPE